ncbi:MAG TPA: transketolase, partial [Azospirillaceae bacterium]|nr:transketolase [Azospirillaceae bacterium]
YDPFIKRGLDAMNYALYQDSRFMVVATPSGVTLAPEGGAHQSIVTPLIGMGLPNLATYEPAFVDELAVIMRWGFEYMQAPDGGSVYLRLSTRSLAQPPRPMTAELARAIVDGGYWMRAPGPACRVAIAYTGAVAPEAQAALLRLAEHDASVGLLAITSADRLYQGWSSAQAARRRGDQARSHVEALLNQLPSDAALVTVIDGHPAALGWLGSVHRNPLHALGTIRFGESSDIPDALAKHGLGTDSIVAAAREACANQP